MSSFSQEPIEELKKAQISEQDKSEHSEESEQFDQAEPIELKYVQAIRKHLVERKQERRMLDNLLALKNRGGISKERALALQRVFRKKALPETPQEIEVDKRERMEGIAEITRARLALSKAEPEASTPLSPKASPEKTPSAAGPTPDVAERKKKAKEAEREEKGE